MYKLRGRIGCCAEQLDAREKKTACVVHKANNTSCSVVDAVQRKEITDSEAILL